MDPTRTLLNQTDPNRTHLNRTKTDPNRTVTDLNRTETSDRRRSDSDRIKGPWSSEEDELLGVLVNRYGARNWTAISKSIPGRSGKSCRLRWCNQLSPEVEHRSFTAEEDEVIVAANRWAAIARLLNGRTDNAVKNHWNSTLKRKYAAVAAAVAAADGGDQETVARVARVKRSKSPSGSDVCDSGSEQTTSCGVSYKRTCETTSLCGVSCKRTGETTSLCGVGYKRTLGETASLCGVGYKRTGETTSLCGVGYKWTLGETTSCGVGFKGETLRDPSTVLTLSLPGSGRGDVNMKGEATSFGGELSVLMQEMIREEVRRYMENEEGLTET